MQLVKLFPVCKILSARISQLICIILLQNEFAVHLHRLNVTDIELIYQSI